MEEIAPLSRACSKCMIVRPLADFDMRADTGRRRAACRFCRRAYQRQRFGDATSTRSLRMIGSAPAFRCGRCGQFKVAEEFHRRATLSLRLHSWCRRCFSEYKISRYNANRGREIARLRRNHERTVAENRHRVADYLLGHPCVDCGEADIVVLDFDHLRDKVKEVSQLVRRGWPWRSIEAEIAKCQVRCANCHRRKTRERFLAARA